MLCKPCTSYDRNSNLAGVDSEMGKAWNFSRKRAGTNMIQAHAQVRHSHRTIHRVQVGTVRLGRHVSGLYRLTFSCLT